MIYFYTGVPGSGKSLHIAQETYYALRAGKNVISNVNINMSMVKPRQINTKTLGQFIYVENRELLKNSIKFPVGTDEYSYIKGLYNFANNFHKLNNKGQMLEGQTLLVLDECQELYNSRTWNRNDRLDWCKFYRIHRHYGFDVILSSQDDKCVDKQIRAVLQTQYLHRDFRNYKLFGKIVSLLFGGHLFIYIKSLYGMSSKKDSRISSKFFTGKKFYNFYDSFERL